MKMLKIGWPILLALFPSCHSKEDGSVAFQNVPAMMSASLPPIDQAVPAKLQTATFALG